MSQQEIKKFIKAIVSKFDLPKADLKKVWIKVSKDQQSAEDKFKGMKKVDIIALCKANSVRSTGTVVELVRRLTVAGVDKSSECSPPPPPPAKTSKAKGKAPAPTKAPTKAPSKGKGKVSSKKTKNVEIKGTIPPPTVQPVKSLITKNEHGNFMHPETRLVFNNESTKACGIQQDDGSVSVLTLDDIETAKKFSFKYQVPENIASNKQTDDNKSEDIEDLLTQLDKTDDLDTVTSNSDDDLEEEPEDD
jgi:hypothetical protein